MTNRQRFLLTVDITVIETPHDGWRFIIKDENNHYDFFDGTNAGWGYRSEAALHRAFIKAQPTIIHPCGSMEWHNDKGQLHRTDGPAMIQKTEGTDPETETEYRWYLNGELHRVDGPAISDNLGTEEWFLHGKRHREDGPALTTHNGDEEWWLNGQLHRDNGPAVEWYEETEWWIHGEKQPRPRKPK